MGDWDDPDLKMASDFVSWDNIGDEIDGIVTAVRKKTFDEGTPKARVKPQVYMRLTKCSANPEFTDGREVCLTPGAHLHALLSQLRPEPGDRLWAKWVRNEKTGQPSPKKVFEAKVSRGAEPVAAAAASDEPPF